MKLHRVRALAIERQADLEITDRWTPTPSCDSRQYRCPLARDGSISHTPNQFLHPHEESDPGFFYTASARHPGRSAVKTAAFVRSSFGGRESLGGSQLLLNWERGSAGTIDRRKGGLAERDLEVKIGVSKVKGLEGQWDELSHQWKVLARRLVRPKDPTASAITASALRLHTSRTHSARTTLTTFPSCTSDIFLSFVRLYSFQINRKRRKKNRRHAVWHQQPFPHLGGQRMQEIWQGQQLTDLRKHALLLTFCLEILASFVDPRQAFGPDKIIPPQILANAKVDPDSRNIPCAGANGTIRVSLLLQS